MTTLSQMADEIALQIMRPDMTAFIASQINLTLREVFFNERNRPVYYASARTEVQVVANTDSGFIWDIPLPGIFQAMEAVQYANVYDLDGNPRYAKEFTPGRILNDKTYYFYRAADSYAFNGYGGLNAAINLSYFEYVPTLKYYAPDSTRPANYDPVTGWTYNAPYDVDATANAQGQALTSNWLLMRWNEMIAEGVRAKVFKHTGDDFRSRLSFSAFQGLRQGLTTAESAGAIGI